MFISLVWLRNNFQIGPRKKGDDSHEIQEERRNCFVAITRTQETLTLTHSKQFQGWPKEPSRFLREMGVLEAGT